MRPRALARHRHEHVISDVGMRHGRVCARVRVGAVWCDCRGYGRMWGMEGGSLAKSSSACEHVPLDGVGDRRVGRCARSGEQVSGEWSEAFEL